MILAQVSPHRAAGESHLPGDPADRLALAVPPPRLLVAPRALLVFGLLGSLLGRGLLWGRRRPDDVCPLLPRLAGRMVRWGKRLRRRTEGRSDLGVVALEEALEHLAEVLQQVPAVGDLHGLGRGL